MGLFDTVRAAASGWTSTGFRPDFDQTFRQIFRLLLGYTMDINAIRMRNYRAQLLLFKNRADQIDMPEHGLLARFAAETGTSARYLSHINNGRKNIGDKLARELESGLGLTFGYMDNEHDEPAPSRGPEAEFLAAAQALFRESPAEAQAMLMRYMISKIKSQNGKGS